MSDERKQKPSRNRNWCRVCDLKWEQPYNEGMCRSCYNIAHGIVRKPSYRPHISQPHDTTAVQPTIKPVHQVIPTFEYIPGVIAFAVLYGHHVGGVRTHARGGSAGSGL